VLWWNSDRASLCYVLPPLPLPPYHK
jgi:hypothetical protein